MFFLNKVRVCTSERKKEIRKNNATNIPESFDDLPSDENYNDSINEYEKDIVDKYNDDNDKINEYEKAREKEIEKKIDTNIIPESFDDLPSDDSCLNDDYDNNDDKEEDDSVDDNSQNKYRNEDNNVISQNNNDNLTLEERILARRNGGSGGNDDDGDDYENYDDSNDRIDNKREVRQRILARRKSDSGGNDNDNDNDVNEDYHDDYDDSFSSKRQLLINKKKKELSAIHAKMILDDIEGTKIFAADFRKDDSLSSSKKREKKKKVVKDSFFIFAKRDGYDNDNGIDDSDDSDDSDEDNDNIESLPSTYTKVTIKTTITTQEKSRHAPSSVSRGAPNLNSSGVGVTIGAHRYSNGNGNGKGTAADNNGSGGSGGYQFLDELRNEKIDRLQQNVVAWKTTGKKGQRLRKKMRKRTNASTKKINNNDYEEGEGISAESDSYTLEKLLRERAEDKRERANCRSKITVDKRIKSEIESGNGGAYHLKRRERKFMEKEVRLEEERGSKNTMKNNRKEEVNTKAEEDRTVKRHKKNMSKAAGLMPFARDAF